MIKSNMIHKMHAKNSDLMVKDIKAIVKSFFSEISSHLKYGGRVELRNFGAFDVKIRDVRVGRNPKTGASIDVPAKKVIFFKAGKLLRERLNK